VGLTIRIPFCRARCPFCLFGGFPAQEDVARLYFKGVKKELGHYAYHLSGVSVSSLYLSGGTPTLFPDEVADLVKFVRERFDFRGEISAEASPLDLRKESTLKKLADAGVTKLSIGVQSFDDGILKAIGRSYDGATAVKAVRDAKKYFDYVNIDLMFSLPGQDLSVIRRDVETAASLEVEGVSTYPLMLPPYTAFSKLCAEGHLQPPKASEEEMYGLILDALTAEGYEIRAIWSFSTRPGSYCGPFEFDEYVSVGPGAWFFLGNAFYFNVPLLEEYLLLVRERPALFLVADFGETDPQVAWLARQLYHTRVSLEEARRRFGSKGLGKVKRFLRWLQRAGLIELNEEEATLTKAGLITASATTKRIVTGLLTMLSEASEARFGCGFWL
jgi:oxygen-independent coproporphyrinogen-3 oxidase